MLKCSSMARLGNKPRTTYPPLNMAYNIFMSTPRTAGINPRKKPILYSWYGWVRVGR